MKTFKDYLENVKGRDEDDEEQIKTLKKALQTADQLLNPGVDLTEAEYDELVGYAKSINKKLEDVKPAET